MEVDGTGIYKREIVEHEAHQFKHLSTAGVYQICQTIHAFQLNQLYTSLVHK